MSYDAVKVQAAATFGPYIHIFEPLGSRKARFDVRVAWGVGVDRRVMSIGTRDTIGEAVLLLNAFKTAARSDVIKIVASLDNPTAIQQIVNDAEKAAEIEKLLRDPLSRERTDYALDTCRHAKSCNSRGTLGVCTNYCPEYERWTTQEYQDKKAYEMLVASELHATGEDLDRIARDLRPSEGRVLPPERRVISDYTAPNGTRIVDYSDGSRDTYPVQTLDSITVNFNLAPTPADIVDTVEKALAKEPKKGVGRLD